MIVISDTTPLISLMKIGKLQLLRELFGEVKIPNAVFSELVSNPSFKNEAMQIQESEFIHKVDVSDRKAVQLIRRATGLDAGESEAIILTDEISGNLLLMDEAKGRTVAKNMGINVMGTIGMLMIAQEKNMLTYEEIVKSIDVLRSSGRHISDKLYNQLLEVVATKKETSAGIENDEVNIIKHSSFSERISISVKKAHDMNKERTGKEKYLHKDEKESDSDRNGGSSNGR